ncbi:MAG: glycosyltransferase family 9 protein [Bacteroidales bacterium]|nr:glycosyltransferase family 9 protein [Bacteroidales bacterium]
MRKILIIQTASIGDVILSTPLIEKLRHFFPEASIDFMLKKGNEGLFKAHPLINNLIIWNKAERKYRNLFRIIKFFRAEKFDVIINIQRFASSGIVTILSGAKKTIGFNKNPFSLFFSESVKHNIKGENAGIHEVDRNLKLIESITDNSSFKVKLYPGKNDFAKVSQYKTNEYICIAPASLWFTKQYPVDKWIEFCDEADKDIYIYFLGSKNDVLLCDEISKKTKHSNCLNLAGKLNFLESAALMKDARMNFVNDSAPLHLASSVNAPTTAIFCSTVPYYGFGPLSDNSVIIETTKELKCRPCGLHGFNKCPEKHFECAYSINNQQLLNRI